MHKRQIKNSPIFNPTRFRTESPNFLHANISAFTVCSFGSPPRISILSFYSWYFNRSRLVMSESLAQQNPHSPFRRAPSMVHQPSRSGRTGSVSSGAFEQETDDLLQVARTNIQKLREREGKKVNIDLYIDHLTYDIIVFLQVVHDPVSHTSGRHDKRLKKHHSRYYWCSRGLSIRISHLIGCFYVQITWLCLDTYTGP